MKVKLGQAVKMFFGNSSLEMVYFEAIANALDAKATEINININLKALSNPETLKIEIADNGVGFTDERYRKFSRLFDVEESSHKGLGRLVYLCYFDEIQVISYYGSNKKRTFDFTESFEEEKFDITDSNTKESGTNLAMCNYSLQRIAKAEYVNPQILKQRILEEFYSRFFKLKKNKQKIKVIIKLNIGGVKSNSKLDESDIPKLKIQELSSSINLIDKFDLYYSIKKLMI